jgi:hypothetical protein
VFMVNRRVFVTIRFGRTPPSRVVGDPGKNRCFSQEKWPFHNPNSRWDRGNVRNQTIGSRCVAMATKRAEITLLSWPENCSVVEFLMQSVGSRTAFNIQANRYSPRPIVVAWFNWPRNDWRL